MANTFPNAKNQHLKNYVPVWTKKNMTDADENDFIDLSWLDTENNLAYEKEKLVTNLALKKLDEKLSEKIEDVNNNTSGILEDFKKKADELVEKAIEHHIEDIAKFKDYAAGIRQDIENVESGLAEEVATREEAINSISETISNTEKKVAHNESEIKRISDLQQTHLDMEVEILQKIDNNKNSIDKEIEERKAADAELEAKIKDEVSNTNNQFLVQKTVTLTDGSNGSFVGSFPSNIKVIEIKDGEDFIYPEIKTVGGGDNDYLVFDVYSAENAPDDFSIEQIDVTYTCTYGDYVAWNEAR